MRALIQDCHIYSKPMFIKVKCNCTNSRNKEVPKRIEIPKNCI